MFNLVHISDLHFGKVDSMLIQPLVAGVHCCEPDLVVISGDLTQRAGRKEFEMAREFLDRLPQPQLVVPGNHDIPLYNLAARFFGPLSKYQRYITSEMSPYLELRDVVIL